MNKIIITFTSPVSFTVFPYRKNKNPKAFGGKPAAKKYKFEGYEAIDEIWWEENKIGFIFRWSDENPYILFVLDGRVYPSSSFEIKNPQWFELLKKNL
jgi:hypothetical protein